MKGNNQEEVDKGRIRMAQAEAVRRQRSRPAVNLNMMKSSFPLLACILFLLSGLVSSKTVEYEYDPNSKDSRDSMHDLLKGKPCPPFRCTGTNKAVAPNPDALSEKFISTGCSGMSAGVIAMANEAVGESVIKPYEECCHKLHACHQICGVARGVCDASFESCAESICEEQVDENKCKEQANLDRIMLNVAGCGKYTASQVDVCQCVAKEDVDKHREAAVEAFYALHNPSNIDKAKGLAEKATTKQKYATLMLKLVNKYYPDVIDVREDPEKKRMQAVVDEQVEKQEKKKKGEQSESSSDDTATQVDEMDYEL